MAEVDLKAALLKIISLQCIKIYNLLQTLLLSKLDRHLNEERFAIVIKVKQRGKDSQRRW